MMSGDSVIENQGKLNTQEEDIRKSLKVKFDQAWLTQSSRFEKIIQDLTSQMQSSNSECERIKNDFYKYKSRAAAVLKQQSDKMVNLTKTNEQLVILQKECQDLKKNSDKYEKAQNEIDILTKTLSDNETDLKLCNNEINQLKARNISAESEIRRIIEKNDHQQQQNSKEISKLKEELIRVRTNARELIEEKDRKIQSLLSSQSSEISSSNDKNVVDININTDVNVNADSNISTKQIIPEIKNVETQTYEDIDTMKFDTLNITTPHNNDENNSDLMAVAYFQARRDDELKRLNGRIRRLQELLRDNEAMQSAHQKERLELQNKVHDLERTSVRSGANIDYLKNIIVKFMTEDDPSVVLSLVPVISTILQFSPSEIHEVKSKIQARCQSKRGITDVASGIIHQVPLPRLW